MRSGNLAMVAVARPGDPVGPYAAVRTDHNRAANLLAIFSVLEKFRTKLAALIFPRSYLRLVERRACRCGDQCREQNSIHGMALRHRCLNPRVTVVIVTLRDTN